MTDPPTEQVMVGMTIVSELSPPTVAEVMTVFDDSRSTKKSCVVFVPASSERHTSSL